MDFLIDPYRYRATLKLTSKPYPTTFVDATVRGPGTVLEGFMWIPPWDDTSRPLFGVTGGVLRLPLITYNDWPDEHTTRGIAAVTDGLLRQPLITYDNWPPEHTTRGMGVVTAGSIRVALVTYNNWIGEATTRSVAAVTSGTLT